MEQAMIPIRVSRLSDWKIYGSQWGHLRSTLDRCGVFFLSCGRSGIGNRQYTLYNNTSVNFYRKIKS